MPLRQLADVAAILAELEADPAIAAGKKLVSLVEGAPGGRLVLPSLSALMQRVTELEERVATLEAHEDGGG